MRDYSFDVMRLISILGVIVMHTTSIYGVDILISLNDITSLLRYTLLYSFSWSVPVFFMLSGALLLSKRESSYVFYEQRMRKILIPTIFWSGIYLCIHYIFDGFSLFSLIAAILKANPYYHLWFMFAIIGLYIFTPIFRIIIDNTTDGQRYVFIIIIFIISIGQNYLNIYLHNTATIFTIFLPYIGFYFLGYELYKLKFAFPVVRLLVLFLGLIVLMLGLGYFSQVIFSLRGNIFASFLSPLVICQAILIFIFITHIKIENNKKVLKRLSALVYGVYLIHPVFILIYINFYKVEHHQLLNIFAATLFTTILSFFIIDKVNNIRFIRNIV